MDENAQKTLFVGNIPYNVTNEKLEATFSDFGPIQSCFVVKDKDKETSRGFGYVKFAVKEDAESAKQQVKTIDGRKINVHFANKKNRKAERQKRAKRKEEKHVNKLADDDSEEEAEDIKPKIKQEKIDPSEELSADTPKAKVIDSSSSTAKILQKLETDDRDRATCIVVVKNFDPSVFDQDLKPVLLKQKNQRKLTYPVPGRDKNVATVLFKSKRDSYKAYKRLDGQTINGKKLTAILLHMERAEIRENQLDAKKCRLIIRNLSFKITDEILRKTFSKFGEITDLNIPKKPDGKMCGFGFVQFSKLAEARNAMEGMNAKPILNRPVAVDWAVAKNKFEQISKTEEDDSGSFSSSGDEAEQKTGPVKVKIEPMSDESVTTDEESDNSDAESDDESDDDIASDTSEEEEAGSDTDEEDESDMSDDNEEESSSDMSDGDGSDSEDEGFSDDSDEDDSDDDDERKSMLPPRKSDVDQGKTLFIRNLSYDTEEEGLCEFFEQYGSLKYGRVVMDPETEHSRGTAFVQFEEKSDADKVLAAANDASRPMMLDGRKLSVAVALTREKAVKIQEQKKKKPEKDSRNLYLAREGLIRPGTQAAEGLSSIDLNKRSKLEATKRAKLKDPNYFISDTRLSVHNIPVSVDDRKLRQVFVQSAGDKAARITECRIMRDLTRVSKKGEGKSKGFGFVNFSEHKHALQALRETNNNPTLFGDKRRLIVEFSMENRAALAAKEKRLERVKVKQETFKKGKTTFAEVKTKKKSRDMRKPLYSAETATSSDHVTEDKPEVKKGPKGLPSHWGPKERHRDKGKKLSKPAKQKHKKLEKMESQKRKADREMAAPKPKKKSRKTEVRDNVDLLVNKYKKQFTAAYTKGKSNKSKWFDS